MFYHIIKQKTQALLKEFGKPYTRYSSVQRWKNKFKNEDYEHDCLNSLARFCAEFSTNPDELIQIRIAELKSTDPLVRAGAEEKLLAYFKRIEAKNPGLAINTFRRVKSFYRANYVSLQCSDPGYTVMREQDYLPTKLEIRKMCELLDLEAKTYLLVLAESCGRPGAVSELTYKDVQNELNKEIVPCQIWLKHKVKMARKKYFTFICGDTKNALQLHVERVQYRKGKLTSSTKIFKTYKRNYTCIMEATAEIGIVDSAEKFHSFRLHCLRKRGQTLLERAHVPLNWVDRILGHVPRGAQGKTYSLPDPEAMRSEYLKAMPLLTIYDAPASLIYSDATQQQTLRHIVREELQKLLHQTSTKELVAIQKMLEKKLQ